MKNAVNLDNNQYQRIKDINNQFINTKDLRGPKCHMSQSPSFHVCGTVR